MSTELMYRDQKITKFGDIMDLYRCLAIVNCDNVPPFRCHAQHAETPVREPNNFNYMSNFKREAIITVSVNNGGPPRGPGKPVLSH